MSERPIDFDDFFGVVKSDSFPLFNVDSCTVMEPTWGERRVSQEVACQSLERAWMEVISVANAVGEKMQALGAVSSEHDFVVVTCNFLNWLDLFAVICRFLCKSNTLEACDAANHNDELGIAVRAAINKSVIRATDFATDTRYSRDVDVWKYKRSPDGAHSLLQTLKGTPKRRRT